MRKGKESYRILGPDIPELSKDANSYLARFLRMREEQSPWSFKTKLVGGGILRLRAESGDFLPPSSETI